MHSPSPRHSRRQRHLPRCRRRRGLPGAGGGAHSRMTTKIKTRQLAVCAVAWSACGRQRCSPRTSSSWLARSDSANHHHAITAMITQLLETSRAGGISPCLPFRSIYSYVQSCAIITMVHPCPLFRQCMHVISVFNRSDYQ